MPDIPQLAFPIRVEGNQVAVVKQGSVQDALAQVWTLCLTPPGWLSHDDDVREFGLASQEHIEGGADPSYVADQITRFVPDADTHIDVHPDLFNPALSLVGVRIASAS